MPRFNPLLDQLMTYPAARLDALKAELHAAGRKVYDFGVGDPHEPAPAFVAEALRCAVHPRMSYPSVDGKNGIRPAIATYMARRFGVELDPSTQVLPTSGSKEAVFHMPLLVIDRDAHDRTVVFPDPGYPAYQRGALFAGAEAHAHLLSGDHVFRPWTLPADVLDRTRLLWLNNPHNPSGAVMDLPTLQRTADMCRERDILLVADETYADIYQDARPHSLLECGSEGVLVIHSLSKRSGMTGYRSGFVAGDASIIARLRTLRTNPGVVPTDFVNAAAEHAWADDAHVAERRAIFAAKKAKLMDFFAEKGFEVVGSQATIYLWVRTPNGESDEDYAARLLQSGIVVSPGGMYGVAGGGKGHFRLALVPTLDEIDEAIDVWRKV